MQILNKEDAVYGTVTSVIRQGRLSAGEARPRPRRTSGGVNISVAFAIAVLALAVIAVL